MALLAFTVAMPLSAKILMRQTGYQTCADGKTASDWEVWETGANGTQMVLKGWVYEKCDGSTTWTPAQASTQRFPDPDDGIEITNVPPPVFSATQWGAFRSGESMAVRFAIESNTLAEMELLDDGDPGARQPDPLD